jgi:hypothetical protein
MQAVPLLAMPAGQGPVGIIMKVSMPALTTGRPMVIETDFSQHLFTRASIGARPKTAATQAAFAAQAEAQAVALPALNPLGLARSLPG